ncbi:regulatory protein, DeoR, partial [Pseudomonas savastanoi pv. glycinea str. race 4]
KKTDRIKQIQQALQDQKAIHLREMAALFEVSEMTLRLSGIELRHSDGTLALRGLDLSIDRGERVAI